MLQTKLKIKQKSLLMAKFIHSLLLFLSLLALISTAYSAVSQSIYPSEFIKSSCGTTLYRSLCVQSLSIFSQRIQKSPKKLALTALMLSLSKARSAKDFVIQKSKQKGLKKIEHKVFKDCVDNIADGVDRLSKSIYELGHMKNGKDFMWHMSNVKTWVSAALTDETTCTDGFAGRAINGKLRTEIRNRIVHVARVTSNALALANYYAKRN